MMVSRVELPNGSNVSIDERGSRQRQEIQKQNNGNGSRQAPINERDKRHQKAVRRAQMRTRNQGHSPVRVSGRDTHSTWWPFRSTTPIYTSGSPPIIERRTELRGSEGAFFKLIGLVAMVALAILFIPALFNGVLFLWLLYVFNKNRTKKDKCL